jgi:WD40 repeat protein
LDLVFIRTSDVAKVDWFREVMMRKEVWIGIVLLFSLVGCQAAPSGAPTEAAAPILEQNPAPTEVPPTGAPLDISSLRPITLDNLDQVEEVDRLYGHSGPVGIVFSPDGSLLGSFSMDGTVRLWDLNSGAEIAGFQHGPNVLALAFSPDGDRIASGGADAMIRIWDVKTGESIAAFGAQSYGIGWQALAWSSDGSMIAAGTRDGAIRLWGPDNGSELAVLRGHINDVNGIALDSSGRFLASASADASVQLWDTSTAERIAVLEGHTQSVGDVAFSPTGDLLASLSGDVTEKDNNIRFWDLETETQIVVVEGHEATYVGGLCFSPDGSYLLATGGFTNNGQAKIYRTETAELVHVLQGEDGEVVTVDVSPDGRIIATGSVSGYIQLWGVD